VQGNSATGSFPLPSQIADVPGAEGWRSMYPYFTRFQPDDDNRFWFYNAMHFPEPMPAFDVVTAEIPYTAIGARSSGDSRSSRSGPVTTTRTGTGCMRAGRPGCRD